jgi:WD40 repeat protein
MLRGHSSGVTSVTFSHDSTITISGSHDGTIRVWSAKTGKCFQILEVGTTYSLKCGLNSTCLFTDIGCITIPDHNSTNTIRVPVLQQNKNPSGLGIDADRQWITWHGKRLLWLPIAFRSRYTAVRDSLVVIGCDPGRVLMLRFSENNLTDLLNQPGK